MSSNTLLAADIASHLPKNTLGYVVVRNIAESDQKIEKLTNLFHPGTPSPLVLAKTITGLSQGINLGGDALFAYLANSNSPTVPTPLVLLPVTDYPSFAAGVEGDAAGEICRVTLADVDLLVAKFGEFALIMNVEHRELMRQALATPAEASANPFAEWIAENDLSLIVTRLGLTHLARQGWNSATPLSEVILEEDEFGVLTVPESLTPQQVLPLADFARRNFRSVGVGLVVDEAHNSRLRWKADFIKPVESGETIANESEPPLLGLAAEPYAVAGGGILPPRAGELFAEYMTRLALQDAQHQGRAEFTREDWAAERKSWDLTLAGVREVSFLMVPPTEGEPLLATCLARLTVDDSAKYLASLTQAYELHNDLTSRSKSEIKMLYEFKPTKIGDVEGLAISTDLDKATGDQNVDVWQAMLTACLGKDHTLTIYCSPVDEHHVFIGLLSPEKLLKFAEGFQDGTMGLAEEAAVKKTLALMDAKNSFVQLVNPKELVEVARAWMQTFLVFGMVPQLPLYQSSPPVAITLSGDQLGWQGEVALPLQTVQDLATFIEEIKKVYGQ